MELEPIKALMRKRDLGIPSDPYSAEKVRMELADEVPGLVSEIERLKKALEDIAGGMVPHAELDGILEMTAEGRLAEARGALYGWCQRRAREALKGLSE